MAWGTDTTCGTLTTITSTVEQYLTAISLNPGELAQVQLTIDNTSGSVANGVTISVYTTLDSTSEVWDDRAWRQQNYVPDGVTAEQYTITVSGIYRFRIGLIATAVTDDYDVSGQYRVDGISL